MNRLILLASAFFIIVLGTASCSKKTGQYAWIKHSLEITNSQLTGVTQQLKDSSFLLPRSVVNGKLRLVDPHDWTSGFFPGVLWYASELTGDPKLASQARKYTDYLYDVQTYKDTHDLGFMMMCSYGNAYRIEQKQSDKNALLHTADNLASRFNPKVGVIRSWDFGKWTYPVIIDNMMNLELLFWAAENSKDTSLRKIAITHANTTMNNHFRKDYSSFHVVNYDTVSGGVISKETFQGYSDSSRWARGQAWGLYGYTVCYRFTHDPKYLMQAQRIANMIMSNPNTPSDCIPYWDYNDPKIPNVPRDASAAAVTAAGLLELCQYVPSEETAYVAYAEKILESLSSDKYMAKPGEIHGFILKHSTGHLPGKSEIDVPLCYADYYYLEALKRYVTIKKINLKELMKS
ncbi:MAG TPA: DUF4995 domain-containing protein [Paludibacter sp.]|nr:DUF4995 domain-containing protein [Paludibacter sp.]